MVTRAENVNFFTFKGYPNVNPIKTGFATPTREVEKTDVNYAKYDQKSQPNLAQYDYRPPVVGEDGVHGLKCNYFA